MQQHTHTSSNVARSFPAVRVVQNLLVRGSSRIGSSNGTVEQWLIKCIPSAGWIEHWVGELHAGKTIPPGWAMIPLCTVCVPFPVGTERNGGWNKTLRTSPKKATHEVHTTPELIDINLR